MNTHLLVREGVILTPVIEPVINQLDPWFKARNLFAYVTSGLRDPAGQMEMIIRMAGRYGVATPEELRELRKHTTYDTMVITTDGRPHLVYCWQSVWSRLLAAGIIVNPPLRAVCLENYVRDGVNKKGQYINESPHFSGRCFDIGGSGNGVEDELIVVSEAFNARVIRGMRGFLLERKQNCIHVDCELMVV